MSLVELSGLSFGYSGEVILEAASAALHAGSCAGLVGPNGAGKSTLLRIIAEEVTPDSGLVQRQRGTRIVHCTQTQAGGEGQNAWELVLGASSQEQAGVDLQVEAKRTLMGLGLAESHWYVPLSTLSGGQRQKAGLARAMITDADVYLFDEPANHLDLDAQAFLAARLKQLASANAGCAVILASHDRWLLDACCTGIWELEGGRLYTYPGNYTKSLALRKARREKMAEEFRRQQEYISRTEEYIRRNIAGQNTKQAQGRRTLLARMERVEAVRSDPSLSLVLKPSSPSGDQVLLAEGIGFGFQSNTCPDQEQEEYKAHRFSLNPPVVRSKPGAAAPTRMVFSGVSFNLFRGEKLGITGNNGCGKTTLLRLLARRLDPSEGVLAYGTNIHHALFAQDSADLPSGVDMLGAMRVVGALCSDGELRAYLARFGFSGDDVFKDCASLSGGERSRLSLARLFWRRPNLLLLDEPDNHLDIYAREALEQFLCAYEGTIVMVTHDRALLEAVCDRILAYEPAAGMPAFRPVYFRGGYADYLVQRERDSAAARNPGSTNAGRSQPASSLSSLSQSGLPQPEVLEALAREARMSVDAYRAKQAGRLRKRMGEIESMIDQAEMQVAGLRAQQRERDAAGDYNGITRLQMEIEPLERLAAELLDDLAHCELLAETWEAA